MFTKMFIVLFSGREIVLIKNNKYIYIYPGNFVFPKRCSLMKITLVESTKNVFKFLAKVALLKK